MKSMAGEFAAILLRERRQMRRDRRKENWTESEEPTDHVPMIDHTPMTEEMVAGIGTAEIAETAEIAGIAGIIITAIETTKTETETIRGTEIIEGTETERILPIETIEATGAIPETGITTGIRWIETELIVIEAERGIPFQVTEISRDPLRNLEIGAGRRGMQNQRPSRVIQREVITIEAEIAKDPPTEITVQWSIEIENI